MSAPYPEYGRAPNRPGQPSQPVPYPQSGPQVHRAPNSQPGYGYQAPNCPGLPAAPQQVPYPLDGYPAQRRARITGGHAWYVGLLVLPMFPGIGSVVASIAMIAVGLVSRRAPEPDRTNGTAAASWGINYFLATILLLGSNLLVIFGVIPDDSDGFFPWGLAMMAWLVISAFHVVISFAFGIRADRGKVVPFRGIPFIK
ncbi:hypothetical protein [Actinomyces sp. MRS3W]|uniref:hypothetical protein n=1 Tax=Actinomyces sp. MRS3W TaxID=2800796 RepID=UPI0028FD0C53|nr:hypothetical protein [Actinomyces sp. MRS3W]MDU0348894.1 hypothetical protein [Actinomyces sp. MRS3W]